MQRFWEKVDKSDVGGCWNWTAFRDRDGYGRFQISKKVGRTAHRVAWEMAHGPICDGLCVLHKCDNPSCVNVEHLFLGTRLDNNRDRHNKGRNGPRARLFGDDNPSRKHPENLPRGANHPHAIITEDIVRDIRSRKATGRELAREYGLRESHVCKIKSSKLWAHVA